MLTIYNKDGIYKPKCKDNKSGLFNGLKQAIAFGQSYFEIWDGKKYIKIVPEDIVAIVLKKDHDSKKPKDSITLVFNNELEVLHYNSEERASVDREKITEARTKNYPFVPLEGYNCKIAIRTKCVVGLYE